MNSVSSKDYLQFEKLCKILFTSNRVIIRHVYNSDGKELLASILLLKDGKRLYNIISCILPKGKKLLANYFLYNEVIKEFADEDIILDFDIDEIEISYELNKSFPLVRSIMRERREGNTESASPLTFFPGFDKSSR